MTSRSGGSRQRFAELLAADDEIVVAPGAYDPLTARMIADLGFPAVYLGGNALALQLGIGQPLATLTETLDAADKVLRAIDVPLIVDAGAGFGAAPHVARTVAEFERLGIAAIHIDDQAYPKNVGYHYGAGRLVETAQMAERLATAAAARTDPDLRLIARTDALRVTGDLDATIARCRAYAAAGADVLMVLDLTPELCARVADGLDGVPLVWIGGVADAGPTLPELEKAGFAVAVYPFTTLAAVMEAVRSTWSPYPARGRPQIEPDVLRQGRADALQLGRLDQYHAVEQRSHTLEEAG
ncbi:MAG: isocitrate lyase/PEP mutase family protein [Pseudonocardia sp.]|uniref:isocitrate lyase/PEP mutase family protein n=1 Tax=unclassified Pseudonocardia TaxID=2619320 RepID=UPI00086C4DC3|nr:MULTISPECIES: isocitrate lyase/PEP mutase family protein [unclassified Pseudonocardia]MBN9113559.1 isocitrate lyase/PEP mutase family protein [Pseudonocardia sp.]ODU28942.1 MAG: hypothetical protein ABS80_02195 [Pseudonocardia sp. SCN 72-51]ODU99523.1 MAG: hypothetical protein ABT15_31525 [Pseudonocardia sp. SCN 73-27]